VATNRHEINIQLIDINMHLAYCLSRICMEEDVLDLAQFSYNKLNNFIKSHRAYNSASKMSMHLALDFGPAMHKTF
jgi:hypothetical protein